MEDSGVWRPFIEGVRNAKPQTFFPPNLRSGIVSQTFISVKPSYAGFGHYILSCKVCQAHFMHKKISQNQGEIVDNRNLFLTNQYEIFRNQDIMVCYLP